MFMTIKTKISFLAFIMFLSLISIGFASWTLSKPEMNQTSDNSPISAEEAINSSKYVTKLDSTNFTYFPNGFTSSEGEIIDSGTLSIKFNVSSQCLKFKFKLVFFIIEEAQIVPIAPNPHIKIFFIYAVINGFSFISDLYRSRLGKQRNVMIGSRA